METNNDYDYAKVFLELLSSTYDSKTTKDEKYATQLMSVHREFVNRNGKLSNLLDDFILQCDKRIKTNNFFKKFIFWFFIGLLSLLTVSVIIVFLKVNINVVNVSSVVSLLSIAVTYLGSLLSIFKIMSTYLFPSDEEKDTIDMIKTVIGNDIKVEEIMSKAIEANQSYDINRLRDYKVMLAEGILTQDEYDDLKKYTLNRIKLSNS